MKQKLYFILIIGLLFSCNKNDPEFQNIDHLKGVVVEVVDRTAVSSGESDIFSFYISGVRFNSDGTFEMLDDGYGGLAYWNDFGNGSDYLWEIEGSQIIFTFNGKTVKWELLEIGEEQLKVLENSEHIIKVSTKQEVR